MNARLPGGLAVQLADSVKTSRRRYRKRLARCQKKFSEKAVHELRVETRRVLALLDLLKTFDDAASLKKIRKVFKKRLDAFDDLRDTQVQLQLLKPLWGRFQSAKPFRTFLRRRERCLISDLRSEIEHADPARLSRRLKELEKHLDKSTRRPSPQTNAELVGATMREAFTAVARLRSQVRSNNTATIHRMRVAFKRFRYMTELLQPFLPHLNRFQLDRMKEYQDAAGNIQDLVVLVTTLMQAVKNGEVTRGETQTLHRELLRRRRRAIDSFMKRIDNLFEFEPHYETLHSSSR